MDVCEILKFVAENPRIPFYQFIFLYHENMEFRVFFEKKLNFLKHLLNFLEMNFEHPNTPQASKSAKIVKFVLAYSGWDGIKKNSKSWHLIGDFKAVKVPL